MRLQNADGTYREVSDLTWVLYIAPSVGAPFTITEAGPDDPATAKLVKDEVDRSLLIWIAASVVNTYAATWTRANYRLQETNSDGDTLPRLGGKLKIMRSLGA